MTLCLALSSKHFSLDTKHPRKTRRGGRQNTEWSCHANLPPFATCKSTSSSDTTLQQLTSWQMAHEGLGSTDSLFTSPSHLESLLLPSGIWAGFIQSFFFVSFLEIPHFLLVQDSADQVSMGFVRNIQYLPNLRESSLCILWCTQHALEMQIWSIDSHHPPFTGCVRGFLNLLFDLQETSSVLEISLVYFPRTYTDPLLERPLLSFGSSTTWM